MATTLSADTYQPQTLHDDGPYGVLIVTADDVEDLEFFYPYYRFIEAGFRVDVATPDGGAFKGKHGLELKSSLKIPGARESQYDMLFVPGGKAPARLKKDERAVELVRQFVAARKPVIAICHGPQLLAEAGVIDGVTLTAWPEVESEVSAAGATYLNQETVADGLFLTARWPGDLPAFTKRALQMLENLPQERGTAAMQASRFSA